MPACQSAHLLGPEHFLRWCCHSMSSCDGVKTDRFWAGADHPEGVTYTQHEGSSQPPGHHPENWHHVSMFCDFGSLHQKHRVGGPPGGVFRDGSNGWRSLVPRGDNAGGRGHVRHLTTIACWAPPTGLELPDASWTDGGHLCHGTSVRSTRGVAASFLTRCRGSRILRPSRCGCGNFGFVSRHKPAEHRTPDVSATRDVEASSITSLCGRSFFSLRDVAASQYVCSRGADSHESSFGSALSSACHCYGPYRLFGVAPPRWRVVSYRRQSLSVFPCSRRVPALTVMSGRRGVGHGTLEREFI